MNLTTKYIIIAVKKKEYLQELLKELEEYITKSTSDGEIDIKHNLKNFTTYIEIKKGYTQILTKYWEQEKIYVASVASKNNIISEMVLLKLQEKGFSNCGIIIDQNYNERVKE